MPVLSWRRSGRDGQLGRNGAGRRRKPSAEAQPTDLAC